MAPKDSNSIFISNILSLLLFTFASFCFQGHLTDRFTPTFAEMIADSIHPLNEKLFYPLGLSDEQLNLAMVGINVVNALSLVPRSMRTTGLWINAMFYVVGLVGVIATGESVGPHVVLISMAVGGALLRG